MTTTTTLLGLTFGLMAAPAMPQDHPSEVEAFAEAVGIRSIQLATGPGLEIWCDDKKEFSRLKDPALAAWKRAGEWLGGIPVPEGVTARVVILSEDKALQRYLPLMQAEGQRLKTPVLPQENFVHGVAHSGSGFWSWPPTILISGRIMHKDLLLTRIVHDLGVICARFAVSEFGAEPPEFLAEGFAGMLVRHSLKKPAGLVSHEGAALKERIHGYGVFANIGAAANDASDDPRTWPLIVKNGVRQMRKKRKGIDPNAKVDALLLRDRAGFARADYAYSWAVVEFLFDLHEPFGEDPAERAKRKKRSSKPLEANRRANILAVLERLRSRENYALNERQRAEKLREWLLDTAGEDADELHAAFMHWAEYFMPKK